MNTSESGGMTVREGRALWPGNAPRVPALHRDHGTAWLLVKALSH